MNLEVLNDKKFGLTEQNQRLTFNTVLIDSTSFWNQTTENFADFGTLVCVLVNSSRWSAPAAGLQLLTGHRDPRGPLEDMVCHSDPLFRRTAQQESPYKCHFCDATPGVSPLMQQQCLSQSCDKENSSRLACDWPLFVPQRAQWTRGRCRGPRRYFNISVSLHRRFQVFYGAFSTLCRAAPFVTGGAARKLNGASEQSRRR